MESSRALTVAFVALASLALAVAAPAGCTSAAKQSTPPSPDGADDLSGGDSGDDGAIVPATPILQPTPATYGFAALPVRGRADARATIFVEGGQSDVATDAADDGRFCVEVPLRTNVAQELLVFAQDAAGHTSLPATLAITQDPSLLPTPGPAGPVTNRAAGQSVQANAQPTEGTLAALTDGNTATNALVPAPTLWLTFATPIELTSVELVFTAALGAGDNTFATKYKVLVSDSTTPTLPPAAGGPGWALLFDITNASHPSGVGDGGVDTLPLATPIVVRAVAFVLIENNKVDVSEEMRVAETRVFGRDAGTTQPIPPAPTCANGLPVQ